MRSANNSVVEVAQFEYPHQFHLDDAVHSFKHSFTTITEKDTFNANKRPVGMNDKLENGSACSLTDFIHLMAV